MTGAAEREQTDGSSTAWTLGGYTPRPGTLRTAAWIADRLVDSGLAATVAFMGSDPP